MALADNLRNGNTTLKYVKGLNIKAANKVGDRIAAAGGVDNVIAAGGYDNTANQGVGMTRSAGVVTMTLANLRGTAEYTIRTKFGNCWEQAIVALVDLHGKGIHSLDLMYFSAAGYDHVWTVIGLDANAEMNNLRSWGAEAVWVDPWQGDGKVFAIDDLVKGKVRNLNAIYKCHTAAFVEAGLPRSLFRQD